MTSPSPQRERVMLGLLHSVEQDSAQSQRSLANEFGVAVGLINTCLRYCVRKGYVKVKRIPARRYAYFLTPKGMVEKSRLTVAHLSHSLSFFRQAKEECEQAFAQARGRGWQRIGLVGAGELADIAILCADRSATELVGVVDGSYPREVFGNLPVARDAASLPPVDALLVTEMLAPQAVYDRLVAEIEPRRVLTLAVLHITPVPDHAGANSRPRMPPQQGRALS